MWINLGIVILVWLAVRSSLVDAYEVIYAVNAGGDAFTDGNNIHYDADPLQGKIGTASDFGKQLKIERVPEWDESLYQTERYHSATFGYDIPIAGDGDYALVLKFSEVYFSAPGMKVFDVVLNGEHPVVESLDIFQNVGKGVAHDEIVYFTVSRGRLYFKEEESDVRGGRVRVEFIKGPRDNPKVNAFVLFKGDLEAIPRLPPLEETGSEHMYRNEEAQPQQEESAHKAKRQADAPKKSRKTSGPRQQDPYTLDDSTVMLPIFIAIGAFIPLLFCLCKL